MAQVKDRLLYLEDGKLLDELALPLFSPERGREWEERISRWLSGLDDPGALADSVAGLEQVGAVGVQELVFSNYVVREQESDSGGQLIRYDPEQYPYKIFTDDLSGYRDGPAEIRLGQVCISPALVSMFGTELGDEIVFPIARNGGRAAFTVAGFFEDPFMGSSMIGMKSFLICGEDYEALVCMAEEAKIDALARPGAMLHIAREGQPGTSTADWGASLNGQTELTRYTEFSHSFTAIQGFMLLLQNAFTGFLLAFAAVLLAVAVNVLGHSIGGAIQQDAHDLGVLKAMGYTTGTLRRVHLGHYLLPAVAGLALGLPAAWPLAALAGRVLVTTTGLLVPAQVPVGLCGLAFGAIVAVLAVVIAALTARIGRITPLRAIQGMEAQPVRPSATPIRRRGLPFWLALRQLDVGKPQYLGVCLTALLLVFFASMMGRMNAWLGPDGKGLMDAFNPADLDMAAQRMGRVSVEEFLTAVEENPVLEGWGNKLIHVSAAK